MLATVRYVARILPVRESSFDTISINTSILNRRSDIARDINKSLILVSNNIAYLKEKGFITPFEKNYTNIGCYFKYKMTDSGIKYLEEGESYYF